jgi:hypothetical protein
MFDTFQLIKPNKNQFVITNTAIKLVINNQTSNNNNPFTFTFFFFRLKIQSCSTELTVSEAIFVISLLVATHPLWHIF